MTSTLDLPITPRSILRNPSWEELRALIAQMPNAKKTEYDNFNVETRVLARSKASTYVVTDDATKLSDQTIGTADGKKFATLQDEYIKAQDMIVIEGWIGND